MAMHIPIDDKIDALNKQLEGYIEDKTNYLTLAEYYQFKITEVQLILNYYQGLKDNGTEEIVG